MKIKFWGVRGSHTVSRIDFLKYGGNTTCLSVEVEDKVFLIDAGSGIINFDIENSKKYNEFNLLFTHVHIDHLQGFMFFNPLYSHSKKVNLYGPIFRNKSFYESIKGLMDSNLFPVGIEQMVGIKSVNILGNNWEKVYVLKNGTLKISAIILNVHPRSGVVAYKFSYNNKSFVFATDIESKEGGLEELIEFSRDTNLLIHDGQYNDAQYTNKIGWGHSTVNMAINNAKLSNSKKLCITHHDIYKNDKTLDEELEKSREEYPSIIFARENLEIKI